MPAGLSDGAHAVRRRLHFPSSAVPVVRPQVSLPVVAGTVVNVKPAFAFVDLDEASCTKMHLETTDKRVYFQTSEVRAPKASGRWQ